MGEVDSASALNRFGLRIVDLTPQCLSKTELLRCPVHTRMCTLARCAARGDVSHTRRCHTGRRGAREGEAGHSRRQDIPDLYPHPTAVSLVCNPHLFFFFLKICHLLRCGGHLATCHFHWSHLRPKRIPVRPPSAALTSLHTSDQGLIKPVVNNGAVWRLTCGLIKT